jgi:plastocyanin
MRIRPSALAVLAVGVLTIIPAACGDDESDSSGSGSTVAATDASGDPAIVIENFTFQISEARAGTIVVENKDSFDHTVTADDGSFSVVVAGNGKATFEVTAPGSYAIHCNFHSTMKGTLVVV